MNQIVEKYIENISRKYANDHTSEYGYRTDFENLLSEVFEKINVKEIEHDARTKEGNKPDFIITKNSVPILYIETKDIGVDLDKVEKSGQITRYYGYQNLILKDYVEFRFYRNGERYEEPIIIATFNKKERTLQPHPEKFELLQKTLIDFTLSHKEPIKSGLHLSKIMVGKAQRIRYNILQLFESKSDSAGDLLKVYDTIKQFDTRYTLKFKRNEYWINSPRNEVIQHFIKGKNIGLLTARSNKSSIIDHFFVSKYMVETKCAERTTQSATFPLYLYSDDGTKTPNLNSEIVRRINLSLSLSKGEGAKDISTSPSRLEKERGDEVNSENDAVNKPRFGKVLINKIQYFGNVSEIAWNFYIGGYQPAQKWLKDRKGRSLSNEDIEHYQKIIFILENTDSIMNEIDRLPRDWEGR